MSVRVLPYATVSGERVESLGWVSADDRGVGASAALAHWDPGTDVRLVQALEVDLAGARADCCLGDDAELLALAVWRASGTGLRGLSPARRVDEGDSLTTIELTISSESLGGELSLDTHLVLGAPGTHEDGAAPTHIGSILWEGSRERIVLEADEARFPTRLVDFSQVPGISDTAGWHIDCPLDDLDAPAMRVVQLSVNSSNAALARAVEQAGEPSPEAVRLLELMEFDVCRSLVESALDSDEFCSADASEFSDESIGATLSELLASVFPGASPAALRDRFNRRAGQLSTQIQAHLGVPRPTADG